MKKLLLSLAVAAMGISAYADEATQVVFDFVEENYGLERKSGSDADGYLEIGTEIESEGVTITFGGLNEGANYWRLWSDGLRAYYKGDPTFTVTAPEGEELTYVSWSLAKSGLSVSVAGSTAPLTEWTGSANSVTFNVTGSANVAFTSITVAYGGEYTPEPEPDVNEYTVAEALAFIADGGTGTAIVSGTVVDVTNFNSTYGSITYYIADSADSTDKDEWLQIYGGLGLNGVPFESIYGVVVGAEVQVKGTLKLYTNTNTGVSTPEMDMNNVLLTYKVPEGVEVPTVPDAPQGVLSVSEAVNDYINKGYTGEALVRGVVYGEPTFNESYGDMNYYLIDEDGSEYIYVYAGLGLGGAKFVSADELQEGQTVVVSGSLTIYNNEPEINKGNYIVEFAGINGIEADSKGADVIYNLQGVRVDNPAKGGIYIINGKKVLVK